MGEPMSFPRYERYKDSGVEWLGEVPDGWEVTRIKNLFEIVKRISGEDGYNVLSITQQGIRIKDTESGDGQLSMDYSKYQFVEVGDFAMNHMDLLTGYVDVSDYLGVTSPDYRVFRIKNKLISFDRYFLFLFQNAYKQKIFFPYGQGASQLGRWRLPTDEFNAFRLPVPPLPEQQTIAAFLDRETAKINALVAEQERLVELLKEKRQTVISHAVTKGLDPDAPMKDSGIEWLGEVPEGWEVTAIKYLGRLKGGAGFPHSEQGVGDEELSFHKVNALGQAGCDEVLLPSENTIDRATAAQLGAFIFPPKSIVFAKVGAALLLGRIRLLGNYACIDNNMMGLVVNNVKYHIAFVKYAMCLIRFDLIANPGAVPSLNEGQIGNFKLVLPPFPEQQTIAAFLDTETAKIDTLVTEAQQVISLLKERRSALISAAVTGKIDVRGIQV